MRKIKNGMDKSWQQILAVVLSLVMVVTLVSGFSMTVNAQDGGYEERNYTDDTYNQSDGYDKGLSAYALEGFAGSYGVTGGGLLTESNANYYKVSTAAQFLTAIQKVKSTKQPSVIEITADINLGCYEVESFDAYGESLIKAYKYQALTHPTLKQTGVSVLYLNGTSNLTIFSSNGSSIKHANIDIKNATNIIIRNIKFDELWEWDDDLNGYGNSDDTDGTAGDYDRNDWDYMTIEATADGIWIDHCTFYKSYDGVVDIKFPDTNSPKTNVTVSWCEFLPGSEDDIFFDVMMNELADNSAAYPYYTHLLEEGMTKEQIYSYAYGQKKTHLFGQGDSVTDTTLAAGLRATLANNYYKDSMDRMPRLRYGISHVYNCIMDAQNLYDARENIKNSVGSAWASKIVSNGASSTCGAQILLENCYISGIVNALNSGNGSSPAGYINAVNSAYYINGTAQALEVKNNTSADDQVLVTDADAFVGNLPYNSYTLYNAEELNEKVVPYAGAGKLTLTALQWEKTTYNNEEGSTPTDPTEPTDPTTPAEPVTTVKIAAPGAIDTYFTLNGGASDDTKSNGKYYICDGITAQTGGRIKLGGTGLNNNITFIVGEGKTATVEAWVISGNSTTNSKVALYDEDGNAIKTEITYCTKSPDKGYVDGNSSSEYGKSGNPIEVTLKAENLASGIYRIATPSGEDTSSNAYYIRVTETTASTDPITPTDPTDPTTPTDPTEPTTPTEPTDPTDPTKPTEPTTPPEEAEENVRQFVERLYLLVLGREGETTGIDSWKEALLSLSSSGVDAGYGFVFSEECKERNLSNEDFVEMLYRTFMNRTSDESGKEAWVSQLAAGVDREQILYGFIMSVEFADICQQYGINVGDVNDVDAFAEALAHYRNQNADLTKFVARCYTKALGRDFDVEGLEAWCRALITGENTPKQVAQFFIFSDEFVEKKLNNEEYVKVLYRTFMGREADEDGLKAWVGVLESGEEDRAKVLEGFSDSAEFAEILKSFGLN